MVKGSFKEVFSMIRMQQSLFWFISFFYFLLVCLFFGLFILAKFSLVYANILKALQFFLLYLVSYILLHYFIEKEPLYHCIKTHIVRSFCYASIKFFLIAFFLQCIRLFVSHFWLCVCMLFFTFVVHIFFLFLEPALISVDKSFVQSFSRSFMVFLKAPLISFGVFVFVIFLRLLALYSFFIFPTWFFADVFLYVIYRNILKLEIKN